MLNISYESVITSNKEIDVVMKIERIKTFLVNPNVKKTKKLLFVKVETSEGISGWGECYTQPDRDSSIKMMVEGISRYLIGRDPFNIKHFTYFAYNDFVSKRGSMEYYCAISGIEQALWDIVGKALNTPVYNLLGGLCREKIRVYANGWDAWFSDGELPERAKQIVDKGFTALKFDPFRGPFRMHVSKEEENNAIKCVKMVREAVGEKVDLLIEVHRRLAPINAIRVAREIEEYNPFWYEEPVSSRNLDALAEVKNKVKHAVVAGEQLYTKEDFRELFEKRAVDIINPDIGCCGGILELKEIAAMAEAYYIGVSPHNYNSTTIATAATIQLCAVIPNFIIVEYFINFEDFGREICYEEPLEVKNGYIKLSNKPGLGLELNEEALTHLCCNDTELPKRKIPYPNEEGP